MTEEEIELIMMKSKNTLKTKSESTDYQNSAEWKEGGR